MKILAVSDIHGEGNRLNFLLTREQTYQYVLFLGDGWHDAESLSFAFPAQFAAVRGNCDHDCDWNESYTFCIGSHTIFMTHGHRYGVKYGLETLAAAAKAAGADIALYGHTHRADCRYVDGVYCINPGHVCYPHNTATYCEIDVEGDAVTPKIIKIE
jgi:hypothetical protein